MNKSGQRTQLEAIYKICLYSDTFQVSISDYYFVLKSFCCFSIIMASRKKNNYIRGASPVCFGVLVSYLHLQEPGVYEGLRVVALVRIPTVSGMRWNDLIVGTGRRLGGYTASPRIHSPEGRTSTTHTLGGPRVLQTSVTNTKFNLALSE